MDKKELREFLGNNHHFHPELNPPKPGTSPKLGWFGNMKPTQPLQIKRQASSTSDGTSSPVGSPLASSPVTANFARQLSRSHSSDDHKDSILT